MERETRSRRPPLLVREMQFGEHLAVEPSIVQADGVRDSVAPAASTWTNHDVSDPGVTLLQLVVFALTVVGVAATTRMALASRSHRRCSVGGRNLA